MEVPATSANRRLLLGSVFAAGALTLGALILIPSSLASIFSSSNFLPHAYCYLYDKKLIALHVGSDAAIWLSYLAISCTLVYLVWRTRREIPFSWMFLAFGVFIVACGFTHLMEVIVLWKPLYWLAGDIRLLTALASVVTALALPALVPQIHNMVTAARLSEERRRQLEEANANLLQLSNRVLSVQDGERRRIARELHDGVGQYLAAIKMSCEVARLESRSGAGNGNGPGNGNGHARPSALDETLNLIDRCTAEVRTLSHLLHPPLLDEMGLASAIPWYLEGYTQRSGIQVSLDMPAEVERFPNPIELALFRVLQESLTNIHRHSGSRQASVRFSVDNQHARLTIEDRGRGLASGNGQVMKDGVGISSMRERVRELGGQFHINSGATGTTVEAVLPLEASLQPEAAWQPAS
jgi:signal transduction histidine kinase